MDRRQRHPADHPPGTKRRSPAEAGRAAARPSGVPDRLPAAGEALLLGLQRSIGNAAVARCFSKQSFWKAKWHAGWGTHTTWGKNMIPESERIENDRRAMGIIAGEDAAELQQREEKARRHAESLGATARAPGTSKMDLSEDVAEGTVEDMSRSCTEYADDLARARKWILNAPKRAERMSEWERTAFIQRGTSIQQAALKGWFF